MNLSITLLICLVTGFISYRAFEDSRLLQKLRHYPYMESRGEYYRFLSSGFVHGSWFHLLINMYVLYTFGEQVEYVFQSMFGNLGRFLYLFFYLSCIIVADIPSYLKNKNNPNFASVGASGAVSGLVFMFIMFSPWSKLSIIFLPFVSFPAILGGVAYLIYSAWAAKNRNDGIDHSAHFYGAIYGIIFFIVIKPEIVPYFFDQLMGKIG